MSGPMGADQPYFKPWWCMTAEATRTIFHYGDDIVVCPGRSVAAVVPLLDGRHTVDAIIAALGPQSETLVRATLDFFESRGMLLGCAPIPVGTAPAARDAVHFIAATQPQSTPLIADAQRLCTLCVGIIGDSHVAVEAERSIAALGANAQRLAWNVSLADIASNDVVLVAPSCAQVPRLDEWNVRALDARATWLSILPFDGAFAAVGPLYIPGETACYECFQQRRAANVQSPGLWWAIQETAAAHPTPLPLDVTLAGLAMLALLRWHLRADAQLSGTFLALELNGEIALTKHRVYRVPRCRVCATVVRAAPVLPWFADRAWTV